MLSVKISNRSLANCGKICFRSYSSKSPTDSKKTALYDFHVSHGAKMVPFAGWLMPIQYSDQSIVESHLHTRRGVSVFDVSHMLQTKIHGRDRIKFIETLVPADVVGLPDNVGTLSVFTNENGGIKDDLIVTKTTDNYLYMVTNAGCIEKDVKHLKENVQECQKKGLDVAISHQDGRSLLAVQGPDMTKLLRNNVSFDLSKLYFMHSAVGTVFGVDDCRVTRCGYTGEDGVEISVDASRAVELCDRILICKDAQTKLAGLGARDSLRLEAGLCLYGNDIDETTTPIEAGLAWLITKRRRQTADFPGARIIIKQISDKNSVLRRRVGLIGEPGMVARAGARVLTADGSKEIGRITSGCPSPSLKKNIAMAYVESTFSGIDSSLKVDVGGSKGRLQLVDMKVTKLPFVPAHYYTAPKGK